MMKGASDALLIEKFQGFCKLWAQNCRSRPNINEKYISVIWVTESIITISQMSYENMRSPCSWQRVVFQRSTSASFLELQRNLVSKEKFVSLGRKKNQDGRESKYFKLFRKTVQQESINFKGPNSKYFRFTDHTHIRSLSQLLNSYCIEELPTDNRLCEWVCQYLINFSL